jgi:uncharacterized protein
MAIDLRESSYNIWTDLGDGRVFGLHGYLGTSLIASKSIIEHLKSGAIFSDPDWVDTALELRAEGFITHFTHSEEREIVSRMHNVIHERRKLVHFVLIPSFDCNFRCSYCFERDLQDEFDNLSNTPDDGCGSSCPAPDQSMIGNNLHIDDRMVDDFYAAVDQIVRDIGWNRVSKNITLFGGEPLWKCNAEAVIRAVQMGIELGFRFSAVTNGYDIEHFDSVLGKGAIESLDISVDGVKEFHDARRFLKGGGPTFERIMKNIQWLLDEKPDVKIAVRVNFDEHNLDHVKALSEEFRERGWVANKNFILFANIVYHKDGGKKRLKQDRKLLENVLKMNGGGEIPLDCFNSGVARKIIQSLKNKKPFQFTGAYCAANAGMQIFSPDGKVYKCWEDIGGTLSHVGEFSPSYLLDSGKNKAWTTRTVGNLPGCPDCRYAMICSGGCAIHAQQQVGDIGRNYCDNFDKRYSISIRNIGETISGFAR